MNVTNNNSPNFGSEFRLVDTATRRLKPYSKKALTEGFQGVLVPREIDTFVKSVEGFKKFIRHDMDDSFCVSIQPDPKDRKQLLMIGSRGDSWSMKAERVPLTTLESAFIDETFGKKLADAFILLKSKFIPQEQPASI